MSCELTHIDAAFQPRRPDALRHQTGSKTCSARLTVRIALRTPVRSSARLYTRLCGAYLPAGFPHEGSTPPEAEPLFRAHHDRASGSVAHFELVHPSYGLSCDSPRRTNTMRTTDFCFPLPDYEHPRLMSYRHLFEAYASPLADGLAPATRRPVDLAFHDAESASVGFVKVGARHHSAGAPDRAVPLTPPSLPVFLPDAFASRCLSGLPRPLRSPLREDETICSTRGAFHHRGTFTHMRESVPISFAFTCVSATTRPSVPFHLWLPELCFRAAQGYRRLDPRPCPSPRLALFTRGADRRFSGSGYRPTTSATDFRRTDTLPSSRFSHSSSRPAHQA